MPGAAVPVKSTGGSVSGKGGSASGNGGSVASNGGSAASAGGANPFSGGGGSGGASSSGSGGTSSRGGSVSPSGGSPGTGGIAGTAGGLGGSSSGGSSGAGDEPCSPPTDVSGGKPADFGSAATVCYRTADDIDGWGCSNLTGWTLKVNRKEMTGCGSTSPLPPKVSGFYYFEAVRSAGAVDYASIYWWGTYHPGPYAPWSGGSATTSDASTSAGIDASAAAGLDAAARSSSDAGALDL